MNTSQSTISISASGAAHSEQHDASHGESHGATNSTTADSAKDGPADTPDRVHVDVTYTERGTGTPILLLHGGGGPQTVLAFADRLADSAHARVITPVHAGFGGTPRPDDLTTVGGLASVYAGLLDALDLSDVVVIGNSIGGWIAAELAVLRSPRVSKVILVDAVGITVVDHPVADFFSLTMSEVADLSFFEPDEFRIDPAALPPEAQAGMAANRRALAVYSGEAMGDPTLAVRLGSVSIPVFVVWGEADRIADPDFGRAFAAAIPGARFELIERTGHMPQLETPERLADTIVAWLSEAAASA